MFDVSGVKLIKILTNWNAAQLFRKHYYYNHVLRDEESY